MGAAPVNAKSPMHHHLRPVEGKGLKPIPLPPEGSIVIGRSARFGILDELVVAHHVECRVIYSPISRSHSLRGNRCTSKTASEFLRCSKLERLAR